MPQHSLGSARQSMEHHFVLVHGAGHGAWCWFKLQALLHSAGHRVTSLDLAGAGVDLSTDPNSVLSFEAYDAPLIDFMSTLPADEKVILVGHSAGGLSVTHAMHGYAEKIKLAIFVAADMLPFGFVTKDDIKDGIPDLPGDVHEVNFGLGPNKPPTSVAIKLEFQRKILYQLSPIQDSILASILVRPWPAIAITSARFEGDQEKLNGVRRVFIETTQDNTLKPSQQEAMIQRWPPHEVLTLDSDHSPFFSAPEQLFELIMEASAHHS